MRLFYFSINKIMKKYLLFSIIVMITLWSSYFFFTKNQKQIEETCSPVGGELVCTRFQCKSGNPLKTFGGSGACSDGSKHIILKTWSE